MKPAQSLLRRALKSSVPVLAAAALTSACGEPAELEPGLSLDAQQQPLVAANRVAAGWAHSVFIMSDGTMRSWGANGHGELGLGMISGIKRTPQRVLNITGAIKASVGSLNGTTLVVRSNGTVWGWGREGYVVNDYYWEDTPYQLHPTLLTSVVDVAACNTYALALKSDGTVWAWGDNAYGQLGDGTTADKAAPVRVRGLTGVSAVACGRGSHSLALKSDGTVWAWGRNTSGQLGDGTLVSRYTPVRAQGLTGVIDITSGVENSYAVRSDYTVWRWGKEGAVTNRVPVQKSGISGVRSIATWNLHVLARKGNGDVWAWGCNTYGALGNGSGADTYTPTQIAGLTGVTAIATGEHSSMALKNDGTLWMWGWNNSGQLGDGTVQDRSRPVRVALP